MQNKFPQTAYILRKILSNSAFGQVKLAHSVRLRLCTLPSQMLVFLVLLVSPQLHNIRHMIKEFTAEVLKPRRLYFTLSLIESKASKALPLDATSGQIIKLPASVGSAPAATAAAKATAATPAVAVVSAAVPSGGRRASYHTCR